jgi:predicted transcriptional regulator
MVIWSWFYNIKYSGVIKVIEKALNILELLSSDQSKEFMLREIADTLNMDHGTCANIIKTLSTRGYVHQDAPRRGYKFGYMMFKLTNTAVNNEELTKMAREEIDKLVADNIKLKVQNDELKDKVDYFKDMIINTHNYYMSKEAKS